MTVAAKGKPAVVRVEAQCGHDDTYYLAPGEQLTIKGGRFTFCLACNEKADSGEPLAEAPTREDLMSNG